MGLKKFLNNLVYIIGLFSTLYIILILRLVEFFIRGFILSLGISFVILLTEWIISKGQAYFRKKNKYIFCISKD